MTLRDKNNYLEIPLEIQAKWRMNLFRICCLLAAIGAASEIVIYAIDSATRPLFLPLGLYRLRFIYIPSSINLAMVLLTYNRMRSARVSNAAKNRWSSALIFVLCANTQFIHYVYGPLLALPCLAIFVSILFADRKLTLCLSLASCVSIVLSCAVASTELRKGDVQLLSDMGLALVMILVSYIASTMLINYIRQQLDFILDGAKRETELLKQLQIDNLMGIYSRSKMESVIDALIHAENSEKLCLVMVDFDNFKTINDTYGHLCGDQVLIRFADTIRQFGTQNIIPCRYGGDEIVIILKDSRLEGAYAFAVDLLRSFASQRYAFAPDIAMSFSCGVAVYHPGMTRDAWLKLADDHLYQAKTRGRNQVYPQP